MTTNKKEYPDLVDMLEASRASFGWLLMKGYTFEEANAVYDTVKIWKWDGDIESICREDWEAIKEDIPGGLLDFIDFKGFGESLLKCGDYEICGKWLITNACDY